MYGQYLLTGAYGHDLPPMVIPTDSCYGGYDYFSPDPSSTTATVSARRMSSDEGLSPTGCSWNMGASMLWTNSLHADPYSISPSQDVFTPASNPLVYDPLLADALPVPQLSVSFCEHGYPVDATAEETPYTASRKCKKRKKQAIKTENPTIFAQKKTTKLSADSPAFIPGVLTVNSLTASDPTDGRGADQTQQIHTADTYVKNSPQGQLNPAAAKFVPYAAQSQNPTNLTLQSADTNVCSVPEGRLLNDPLEDTMKSAGIYGNSAAISAHLVPVRQGHIARGSIEVPAALKSDLFGSPLTPVHTDASTKPDYHIATLTGTAVKHNEVDENRNALHNQDIIRTDRTGSELRPLSQKNNSTATSAGTLVSEACTNSETTTQREQPSNLTQPHLAEVKPVLAGKGCHPLETCWTLYHMNAQTKKGGADWSAGIKAIGVFDTVESFFFVYINAPKPSETPKGQDYMFFRGGCGNSKSTPVIRAAWEDEKNMKGGMWRFTVPMQPRGPGNAHLIIDFYWKEILLALIGEQFGEHNDNVNGCYFCNRSDECRFQVWMGTNEATAVTDVGVRLLEVLELKDNLHFEYCSHEDSNRKGNRYAKPLHDQTEVFRLLAAKKELNNTV